jgi:hypothetical protein
MKLTPNIQVIRPTQKNVVSVITGGIPSINRKSIDTATVIGVRLQLIF